MNGLIAVVMAAPLVLILLESLGAGSAAWWSLLRTQVPQLLTNTALLAGLVTTASVGLGLGLAWLVERTDLPGRRLMRPLLLAPLVVPGYVVAICYVAFFGVNGALEQALASLGIDARVPNVYGLGGATLVLTLETYPFTYAIACAAWRRVDGQLIDAARTTGAGRGRIAQRLVLPLLFPSISAGALLASLHVLSDFGTIAQLRYRTFVYVIYQQITGRYDLASAAVLGVVLVLLAFGLLWGQGRLLRGHSQASRRPSGRVRKPVELGAWRWPAFGVALLPLMLGLALPIGMLLYGWAQTWIRPDMAAAAWGASGGELLGHLGDSLASAGAAACVAALASLPLAYGALRRRGRLSGLFTVMSQSGQALPGVLIALGLLMAILQVVPVLYATVAAVVVAYVVRFFPQAFQATRAGLTQVPETYEESARTLGHSALAAFGRVTLPLLRPALLSGWMLVFLSALRELPATLILRPIGFETLPVRIWTAASEGYFGEAAPAALLLIGLSLPLLYGLHREPPSDRPRRVNHAG